MPRAIVGARVAAKGAFLRARPGDQQQRSYDHSATATNSHTLQRQPAGEFSVTISGIAEKLASLYDLREQMGRGDWQQSQRLRAILSEGKDDGKPIAPFEIQKDRANAEALLLEALLLQQDPRNQDEALALVCLIDTYFQGWAGEAYLERNLPKEQEAMWDQLTFALAALARWLCRSGATSPIRSSHFSDRTMRPVEEQVADLQRQASELAKWHSAAKQETRP
jgi:hypothetical protein